MDPGGFRKSWGEVGPEGIDGLLDGRHGGSTLAGHARMSDSHCQDVVLTPVAPINTTVLDPPAAAPSAYLSNDLFLLATTASQTNDTSLFGFDPTISGVNDWGLDEPDVNIFDVLNIHAPNSPTWDFVGDFGMNAGPNQPNLPVRDGLEMASRVEVPDEIHGSPSEILDGQPYDSPWVSSLQMSGSE